MNFSYQNYLYKYQKELESINQTLLPYGFKCIFNKQLLQKRKIIKAIIVMDNPGREEYEMGEYLVGTAGKAFNKVLSSIGLSRDEVLVFNKTSMYTKSTLDLLQLYTNEELKKIFLQEQKITFNYISSITKQLQVPLLIHGYSAYFKNGKKYLTFGNTRPLFYFFKLLDEDKELKKYAHFYKHSSYGNLSKQVSSYAREQGVEQLTYEQFLELGKKNMLGF
jgi:hypothetical protein